MVQREVQKITYFASGDRENEGQEEDETTDAEVKEKRTRVMLLLDLGHEVRPKTLQRDGSREEKKSDEGSAYNCFGLAGLLLACQTENNNAHHDD